MIATTHHKADVLADAALQRHSPHVHMLKRSWQQS